MVGHGWVYYAFVSILSIEFFETPKSGYFGIFVLLNYENELEIVASDISFNSVSFDISKFVFKCIWPTTILNIFPFEVIQ